MAYLLRGTVLGNCHCHDICPCNFDLRPNGPNGDCKGWMVFNIREGNKDKVDLSGLNTAIVYTIPDKPSGGNWRIGLIADKGASDEQVAALESIFSGKEGGVFGDFSALFSEWLGVQRASLTYSDGETPTASVEGVGQAGIEPYRDMEGKPTTIVNAAFGMGPELIAGRGSGRVDAFGIKFDATWGEVGEVEFTG